MPINVALSEVQAIGERIGRAIARDAIADGMPRQWTGLDGQDSDAIPTRYLPWVDQIEDIARRTYKKETA